MRKDWREVYYEDEHKPFSSRHPEGQPAQAEERAPLSRNLRYPPNWPVEDGVLNLPEGWESQAEPAVYTPLDEVADGGNGRLMHTDQLVINFGPQHPSTHGVLRMVARLDGETIQQLETVVGYLHRSTKRSASAIPGWATYHTPTGWTMSAQCRTTLATPWRRKN